MKVVKDINKFRKVLTQITILLIHLRNLRIIFLINYKLKMNKILKFRIFYNKYLLIILLVKIRTN